MPQKNNSTLSRNALYESRIRDKDKASLLHAAELPSALTQLIWPAASGAMAAPTTPPLRPQPMAYKPPRNRREASVLEGVRFANAISNAVIWKVDQRVSIGAAIRELSKRTGSDVSQIKLLNDRGPVSLKEDIDEDVAVLLVSE